MLKWWHASSFPFGYDFTGRVIITLFDSSGGYHDNSTYESYYFVYRGIKHIGGKVCILLIVINYEQ